MHRRWRCLDHCCSAPPGDPRRCSLSRARTYSAVPLAALGSHAICSGHWLDPPNSDSAVRVCDDVHLVARCSPRRARSGRRETFGIFPGERNFNRFPAWLVRAICSVAFFACAHPHLLHRVRTRHRASNAGCCQSCRLMPSSLAHALPTGVHQPLRIAFRGELTCNRQVIRA